MQASATAGGEGDAQSFAQLTDSESHPLSYFQTKGSTARRVGTLAGFNIRDLFRTNNDSFYKNEKLILFRTGANRYRAIFERESSVDFSASEIVRVGEV